MEGPLSVSTSDTGMVKLERDVVTPKKSKLFKHFAYHFFNRKYKSDHLYHKKNSSLQHTINYKKRLL